MLGSGVFVATGSLPFTAPQTPTLTLWPSGKVLIEGQSGASGAARAALYDPATGTWTATGNPVAPRYYDSATLLKNGKVFVAGGNTNTSSSTTTINTTEMYDPATGTWSPGPNLLSTRARHTATLLPNGKVLIAGGMTNYLDNSTATNTTELYDPATNTITAGPSFAGNRKGHQAILLGANDKVLLAGGVSDTQVARDDANVYDPKTNSWSKAGTMTTPRGYFAVAEMLPGGRVLAAGGWNNGPAINGADVYDPATNTWTPVTPMTYKRDFHSLIRQPDGRILALGGIFSPPNVCEVYDPATNSWIPTGYSIDNHFSIGGSGAVELGSGAILTAPGNVGISELYRPVLPRTKTDFSGDLKSDIVFQNDAGTAYVFYMNGSAVQGAALMPMAAPGWELAGIGDFNGDGMADLLWVNAANPTQYWIFLMNGTTIIGNGPVTVAAGYEPTYIADFNGDGKDDILWENGTASRWFFFMNGVSIAGYSPVPLAAPGWEIAGVGNFDGVHGADLLWANTASPGTYWIYLLNGGTVIGSGPVNVGPGYQPTWIGDMNRDGKADIIWEAGPAPRYVFMMNGATVMSSPLLPVAAPGWSLVGVGDYDNFHGVDLLWQNSAAPTQYWIYLLSTSATVVGGGGVTVAPGYIPLTHALSSRLLPPGWSGHVQCAKKLTQGTSVTGVSCPNGTSIPDEVHDWYVNGPQAGTNIPTHFTAQGSWCQGQWTVNTATDMQMGFSSPAGVPSFDRTANFFSTPYAGSPLQTFREFDFPSIQGPVMSTAFSGSNVYILAAGDVPTISNRAGTVTCNWDFIFH